jgi:hypothetical protein
MPRLILKTRSTTSVQNTKATVSGQLLTVLAVCVFAYMGFAPANSQIAVSNGVSGGDVLTPFIGVQLKKDWTLGAWNVSVLGDGRAEKEQGLGDAEANVEWHADTALSPQTELELDAAYAFDRERGEAVKQFHKLGADVGVKHRFDDVTLKADVGFESQLFEDTTQAGYSPLDRSHEDYTDSEAALRLTFLNSAQVKPFIEAAYVQRDYLLDPDRGYVGPELVGGVSFFRQNLTGDAGVMLLLRTANDGKHSRLVGPYVDLKWLMQPGSEISLGVGAGLDQDTSGSAELFSRYSGRLEIQQDITHTLALSVALDVIHENHSFVWERELTPNLTLTWTPEQGINLYGSVGLTHTKTQGEPAEVDPSIEIGLKWTL